MTDEKNKKYNIKEYKEKCLSVLSELEKNQKPGQGNREGSKHDVLLSIKNDIKSLLKKGYTAKEIAEELSKNLFAVSPRSITQIANPKKSAKTIRSRVTKSTSDKEKQLAESVTKEEFEENNDLYGS